MTLELFLLHVKVIEKRSCFCFGNWILTKFSNEVRISVSKFNDPHWLVRLQIGSQNARDSVLSETVATFCDEHQLQVTFSSETSRHKFSSTPRNLHFRGVRKVAFLCKRPSSRSELLRPKVGHWDSTDCETVHSLVSMTRAWATRTRKRDWWSSAIFRNVKRDVLYRLFSLSNKWGCMICYSRVAHLLLWDVK